MVVDLGSMESLTRIDASQALSWQAEIEANPGSSTKVRRFGDAIGFITPDDRSTLANRVVGIGSENVEEIADVVGWYEENGAPPRIDVCPARQSEALVACMQRYGLKNCGSPRWSRRVLAGVPAECERGDGQVEVRPVKVEEVPTLVTIQDAVWGRDARGIEKRIAEAIARGKMPGHKMYFACVDGVPAAAATLHLIGKAGYLNSAATLEAYRGRGCQSALIRRRIQDVIDAGYDLVHSVVRPGSGSERNLTRAGLAVLCDRELWLPPDWASHPFYK